MNIATKRQEYAAPFEQQAQHLLPGTHVRISNDDIYVYGIIESLSDDSIKIRSTNKHEVYVPRSLAHLISHPSIDIFGHDLDDLTIGHLPALSLIHTYKNEKNDIIAYVRWHNMPFHSVHISHAKTHEEATRLTANKLIHAIMEGSISATDFKRIITS